MVGTVKHTKTLEDMAVYRALYCDKILRVRPLRMFMEEVEINEKKVPRFKLVEQKKTYFSKCQNFRELS